MNSSCERCKWLQKLRFDYCRFKGIYLYTSVCKDEEGGFCEYYSPLILTAERHKF